MFHNRFRQDSVPAPQPSADAFLLCPVACLPGVNANQAQWQQALYQWALAEAVAVARPSLLERDLLGVWN